LKEDLVDDLAQINVVIPRDFKEKSLIMKMTQIQKKTKSYNLKRKWKIKNNSSKLRTMKQSVVIQDHLCRFLQVSTPN
jgi:hypothetical protein